MNVFMHLLCKCYWWLLNHARCWTTFVISCNINFLGNVVFFSFILSIYIFVYTFWKLSYKMSSNIQIYSISKVSIWWLSFPQEIYQIRIMQKRIALSGIHTVNANVVDDAFTLANRIFNQNKYIISRFFSGEIKLSPFHFSRKKIIKEQLNIFESLIHRKQEESKKAFELNFNIKLTWKYVLYTIESIKNQFSEEREEMECEKSCPWIQLNVHFNELILVVSFHFILYKIQLLSDGDFVKYLFYTLYQAEKYASLIRKPIFSLLEPDIVSNFSQPELKWVIRIRR